jgi:hypothetical protein
MWITIYRLLRYGRLRPSWDLLGPRSTQGSNVETPQVMFRAVLGRISSSAGSHSTGPNERMGKHLKAQGQGTRKRLESAI